MGTATGKLTGSTKRVSEERGWVSPGALPKGPNGRALCRRCDQEVPKGRRSFCSDECVHEHRLRSDTGYLRAQVWKRDKGICAACGRDAEAWWRSMAQRQNRMLDKLIRRAPKSHEGRFWAYTRLRDWNKRVGWRDSSSAWQADHIIPVVEGGGECGLENLRTLCTRCHKAATAELARRRSKAGRLPVQETLT